MLSKEKRLNLKHSFKWAATGKRLETKNFKLFLKLGENTSPLIGIGITTSIFKKAAQRSKAKRIASKVSEAIYKDLRKNLNLVIMPKIGVLTAPAEELVAEIESLKKEYE